MPTLPVCFAHTTHQSLNHHTTLGVQRYHHTADSASNTSQQYTPNSFSLEMEIGSEWKTPFSCVQQLDRCRCGLMPNGMLPFTVECSPKSLNQRDLELDILLFVPPHAIIESRSVLLPWKWGRVGLAHFQECLAKYYCICVNPKKRATLWQFYPIVLPYTSNVMSLANLVNG